MTELLPIIQGSLERAPWGWALLATVILALIKTWPILSLQAQTARDKLRSENRSDLSDCQKQIKDLRAELETVKEHVHHIELKLVGAISAYRIVEKDLELRHPDAVSLMQARAVFQEAFRFSEPPMTGEIPSALYEQPGGQQQ